MEETKLRAPVQLPGDSMARYHNSPKSIGFFGVYAAVMLSNGSIVFLIWLLCFMGHIHHEQGIMQKVADRFQELKKVPPEALSDSALGSQTQEILGLMNLDKAARQSAYDPLWFVSTSP